MDRDAGFLGHWRAFYENLRRTRFIAIVVAIGIAGVFTGQGNDVLRSIAEGGPTVHLLCLYAAVFLWALMAWYWARILLGYRFDEEREPAHPGLELFWQSWLPRLYGIAAIGGVGAALAATDAPQAWPYASVTWALGLVFALFVICRRRLFPGLFRHGAELELDRWPGLLTAFIDDFSAITRGLLVLSLLVALAMFLLLTWAPVTVGTAVGTAGIFLLWAATAIPLASLGDLLTRRTGVPLLTLLIAWGIAVSFWMDNHQVQRADKPVAARPLAKDHFADWWIALRSDPQIAKLQRQPVILLASEGGGIRSAYWTAIILGHLQDANPQFARHLYAMSGVSGGSMGAAVFAAQVAAATRAQGATALDCPFLPIGGGNFQNMAKSMLGRDYLAPLVGALLYPDTFQRIWPVAVTAFDRARAFEETWEVNWAKSCGLDPDAQTTNPFAAAFAFQELWQGERRVKVPQLLLNTTRVETGQRGLSSSLAWERERANFVDVVDLLDDIERNATAPMQRTLPLVTAASLSARFPIVTPVGSLAMERGGEQGLARFADGGYYENSGAASLLDLEAALQLDEPVDPAIYPVILQVSNDTDAVLPLGEADKIRHYPEWMGEIMSPIRTFLNTRSARGAGERNRLRELAQARGWPYLHFRLCANPDYRVNPPLGWTLSGEAQSAMDDHLTNPRRCAAFGVDNVAYLRAILDLLDGKGEALESFVPGTD